MTNLQASPSRPTVILVESNPLELEKFKHISHTACWNLILCEDGLDVIQWLNDNHTADLLVIEENSTPINGYQISDYIKTELGLALPIIVSTGEIPIAQEGRMLSYAEAFLKKPFIHNSVCTKIEEILKKSSSLSSNKNQYYSLNYLNELSGGDKQFIEETIELFNVTIYSELQNLNEVLFQENYIRIREIAHHIKPSFEMLENERGKGICHLLNSNAKEEDISSLINDLNLEFINIQNELSKDFPEINFAV